MLRVSLIQFFRWSYRWHLRPPNITADATVKVTHIHSLCIADLQVLAARFACCPKKVVWRRKRVSTLIDPSYHAELAEGVKQAVLTGKRHYCFVRQVDQPSFCVVSIKPARVMSSRLEIKIWHVGGLFGRMLQHLHPIAPLYVFALWFLTTSLVLRQFDFIGDIADKIAFVLAAILARLSSQKVRELFSP